MYYNGDKVPQNKNIAQEFFRKSCSEKKNIVQDTMREIKETEWWLVERRVLISINYDPKTKDLLWMIEKLY